MSYVSSSLLENGGNNNPKNGVAGNQHTFKIEITTINRLLHTQNHLGNWKVPVIFVNNDVIMAQWHKTCYPRTGGAFYTMKPLWVSVWGISQRRVMVICVCFMPVVDVVGSLLFKLRSPWYGRKDGSFHGRRVLFLELAERMCPFGVSGNFFEVELEVMLVVLTGTFYGAQRGLHNIIIVWNPGGGWGVSLDCA